MGFNLGSFLGAAGNAALSTYKTISEQQNRDALTQIAKDEEARKALEFSQQQGLKKSLAEVPMEGQPLYQQGDYVPVSQVPFNPDEAAEYTKVNGGKQAVRVGATPDRMATRYDQLMATAKALQAAGDWKGADEARMGAAKHLQMTGQALRDSINSGAMDPVAGARAMALFHKQIPDGTTPTVFQQGDKWFMAQYNNQGVGAAPVEITKDAVLNALDRGIPYASLETLMSHRKDMREERESTAKVNKDNATAAMENARAANYSVDTDTRRKLLDLGYPAKQLEELEAKIGKYKAEGRGADANAALHGVQTDMAKLVLQNEKEFLNLQDQYGALSDEERSGAKGKDLERRIAINRVKGGKAGVPKQEDVGIGKPGEIVYDKQSGMPKGYFGATGELIPYGIKEDEWTDARKKHPELTQLGITPKATKDGNITFMSPTTKEAYPTPKQAIEAEQKAITANALIDRKQQKTTDKIPAKETAGMQAALADYKAAPASQQAGNRMYEVTIP